MVAPTRDLLGRRTASGPCGHRSRPGAGWPAGRVHLRHSRICSRAKWGLSRPCPPVLSEGSGVPDLRCDGPAWCLSFPKSHRRIRPSYLLPCLFRAIRALQGLAGHHWGLQVLNLGPPGSRGPPFPPSAVALSRRGHVRWCPRVCVCVAVPPGWWGAGPCAEPGPHGRLGRGRRQWQHFFTFVLLSPAVL